MMTGAFIASQLPHPAVYIPLTLVSHYLQDWIPHWDAGTGLSNGSRTRLIAFLLQWIDLAVAVAAVYFLWQAGQDQIQYHVWIGAMISLVPDFLEAPRNFLRWEPFFLKPFNYFHGKFHHSTTHKLVGLIPQILTLGLIWLLI